MNTLIVEPFYDTYTKSYKNIITVNLMPNGPLRRLVTRVKFNKFGPNGTYLNCNRIQNTCGLALNSLEQTCCGDGGKYGCLMTPDEIPNLFAFLAEKGYMIDTSITNMMNFGDIKLNNNRKILCFFKYTKN